MKKSSYVFGLLLIVVLVGCNLPITRQTTPSSPEAAFTQAAQTVAAELTRVALLASPTSSIPTNTPIPTCSCPNQYTDPYADQYTYPLQPGRVRV